ncbi:type II toxin-antitoxin system VapC family toxin [bacterium]|nr:type II toxin-antitoxin system VapC family toxin [Methanomicrobia archaeon]MCD6148140.1 type II toxin-antitoxin system VapC family toxin [bacterium]HDM22824.1 PIN domain-containing protein [Methanomicrobia archaeon]
MEREKMILDASVIVKWFTREEKREEALRYREMFINDEIEIVVPDLILYEIGNALRYNPSFNDEDVRLAVRSLIDLGINIIIPTTEILDMAINLAFKYDTTLYDSVYLALAEILNDTLVTADKNLYDKTKEKNIKIL